MVDWFEAEPPLRRHLFDVVDRLRRRAAQRWWLVALLTVVLTGAVVRKVAKKPRLHRARVILAITEGDLNAGFNPTPLGELADYINRVLLSSERLLAFCDERGLLKRERALYGDAIAISEFRDQLSVGVWRNYFQYAWSYDERRSARVAVAFTDADPDFAYEMARGLAHMIQDGEAMRRGQAALELAAQAEAGMAKARARLDEVAREQSQVQNALVEAQLAGRTDEVTVLRARAATLATEWRRATETFKSIEGATDLDQLQAQVNAAGLALDIEIVDERRPKKESGSRIPGLVILGVITFLIVGPVVTLVVGSFDRKVHDADDLRRLKLPVIGHVPGFPGDGYGSLRKRGVRLRRVPSYRRWL